MTLLAAIRSERQKLENVLGKLQSRLNSIKAAAKALGHSASVELGTAKKRVLSAAARAKISRAAKKRWANVRVGAKKGVS